MSCGSCNGKAASLPLMQMKARAAMCQYCPKKRTCAREVCPLNRWPNEQGEVRYLGWVWLGVPWPIRFRLALHGAWLAFRERLGPDYLPGCGCMKGPKDLWQRLRGRLLGKRASTAP